MILSIDKSWLEEKKGAEFGDYNLYNLDFNICINYSRENPFC